MRRAVELFPGLFDGDVDREGTEMDARGPNLLTDLAPAVLDWARGASAFDPASTAASNVRAAG